MSETTAYTVKGMTCGHCVSSVSTEIGHLEGVTGVDVDLVTGRVDVTSAEALYPEVVRAAVEEAGYEMTP